MTALETVAESTLPVAIHDSVREATEATLAMILGAEPTYLGDGGDGVPFEGAIGIISFIGEPVWSLLVGLPKPTAVAIAEKFIGMEIEFDGPDMGDTVGELANVLAGDIVARLDAAGTKAEMSLPTVVRGMGVDLSVPGSVPAVRFRYHAEEGPFWVKVMVDNPHRPLGRRAGS